MDAMYASETSVHFQRTTLRYIPEDSTLHNHGCENFKSHKLQHDSSLCVCVCVRVRVCAVYFGTLLVSTGEQILYLKGGAVSGVSWGRKHVTAIF
jgi:hypothetical protein